MVPVPQEHVADVMAHVARLVARASVGPWDDEALGEAFDSVDEACRSVLSLVARNVVSGKDVSDEDAAKALELNVREIRAIVRDLAEVATRVKREPILSLRETSVVLRNGRTVQRRMFAMAESNARALRAHERASLPGGDEPGPGPTE